MKLLGAGIYAAGIVTAVLIVRAPVEERVHAQTPPQDPVWRELGPYGMPTPVRPDYPGNGRVSAIAFHPTNAAVVWIGAPGGGVWRSDDSGQTWLPIGDQLPNMAVSSIAVDPRPPHTMYVATGDGDWRRNSDLFSAGIFASTDGLKTVHRSLAFDESQGVHVRKVMFHPADSTVLLAVTSRGIYRHTVTNGTASWDLRNLGTTNDPLPADYKTEHPWGQGFVDLALGDTGGNIWYAALSGVGVYRSADAGSSWQLVTPALPANAGRIVLAIGPGVTPVPGAPRVAYALVANARDRDGYGTALIDMLESTNNGETWTAFHPSYRPTDSGAWLRCRWYTDGAAAEPEDCLVGSQGDFNLAFAVSPADPTRLILGSQELFQSTDGGRVWDVIANYNDVHPDYHAIAFVPGSNGSMFLAGSDGGPYRFTWNGQTWTPTALNARLSLAQIWRVDNSETDPRILCAGLQDNGTVTFRGAARTRVAEGDGADCLITGIDVTTGAPNLRISGLTLNVPVPITAIGSTVITMGRQGMRPFETILHFFAVAPKNPLVMYTYGQVNHDPLPPAPAIWKSTDGGQSWVRFVCSTRVDSATGSPVDSKCPANTYNPVAPDDPWFFSLAVEPDDPSAVWIGFSGWWGPPNKVWRVDGQTNWQEMGTGLSGLPVRAIVIDPNPPNDVYAGTDRGVYVYRRSDGAWKPYGTGLPNVLVRDLDITPFAGGFSCLRAGTWGRGVWEACKGQPPVIPPDRVHGLSYYSHAAPVFWDAPSVSPVYYEIRRRPAGATTYQFLATNITVRHYRDDEAEDDRTYQYQVIAHAPNQDVEYVASLPVQPKYRLPRYMSEVIGLPGTPPTLDGQIDTTTEWKDTQVFPMTLDDPTEFELGVVTRVTARVKYDANNLYIAVIDENVSATSTNFELTASLDWDQSREWPATANDEGSFKGTATRSGTIFHEKRAYSTHSSTVYPGHGSMDYAFGVHGGAAHHEMRIAIPPMAANCGSVRCLGLALESRVSPPVGDLPSPGTTGIWPYGAQQYDESSGLVANPFAFGDLRLATSLADLDLDANVDCDDLAVVKSAIGRRSGLPGYKPAADVNGDGVVDVRDLAFVARTLPVGTRCP